MLQNKQPTLSTIDVFSTNGCSVQFLIGVDISCNGLKSHFLWHVLTRQLLFQPLCIVSPRGCYINVKVSQGLC